MKSPLNYLSLIFFLFLGSTFSLFAQEEFVRCYTVEADQQLRAQHPELGTLEEFEAWLAPKVRAYKQSGNSRAVTSIPIIFHVIHNGNPIGNGDNLAATYINAQIDQLNNDFRRIQGTSGFNSDPRGADSEIEFCAATVDPNGNPLSEPGINRINRNAKGWSAPPYGTCVGGNFGDAYIENTIKPQSQWNPDDYLNVWIMDINCSILGYAQFPSASGLGGLGSNGGAASTDGVVLLTSSIGSSTTPNPGGGAYNEGRTATHEVGHFFGLRHIWGDANCGNDYCADTPQASGPASGCPTKTTCDGSLDMVENYMDYSNDVCMNIFTSDQKARMQTVLANSPRRGSLGSSPACSGGGGGGSFCTSAISSFPYAESFESGLGTWSQGSGDDFNWTRKSGGTPSSNTGPSAADDGSFYVFTEASSPNYPSKTTILDGPCFDLSGQSAATFTFSYHLYGATTMGSVALQAKTEGGSWTTIWSESGNQGNAWLAASVSMDDYLGTTVQVRFSSTTGNTWQGDIALDDIGLSTSGGGGGGGGSCTNGISSFPYSEGFESSFGAWTNESGDDFDWARRSGTTPSGSTGPTSATEGSFYAYVESSSPNYPSKTTLLRSPCFDLSAQSSAFFNFAYHLYGASTMGSLSLEVSTTGGSTWTSIWSLAGNQGNSWQTASLDLGAYTGGNIELRFVGVTGDTWQGDMAVDDISLTSTGGGGGGGGGGCTDVVLTLNFDNYPEETSWQISNGSTVLFSGGPYGAQEDGSTINLTGCIDDGCYTLTVLDSYGDGICCSYGNGSYSLTAGGTVLASGSTFGSSESTNFCLSGGVRQALRQELPKTSTTLVRNERLAAFPNPAWDFLQIRYLSKEDAPIQISIVDPLGKTIRVENWQVAEGKNQTQLDISNLPNGTYLMVVGQGASRTSKRFVVMHD